MKWIIGFFAASFVTTFVFGAIASMNRRQSHKWSDEELRKLGLR